MKRIIILSVAVLALGACNLTTPRNVSRRELRREAATKEKSLAPVPVEALDVQNGVAATDVEILWIPPTDPVDGFVVRYGYSKDDLNETVKIPLAEAEIINDPKHGNVMHYIIRDVAADKKLYITLSIFIGDTVFLPDEMFVANPY